MGPGHISGDGGSWARHLSAKSAVPVELSGVWVTCFQARERLLPKRLLQRV